MLCQHLGFEENTNDTIDFDSIANGEKIATGHLVCHKPQPNHEISCCIYLEPSTTTSEVTIPYVRCKSNHDIIIAMQRRRQGGECYPPDRIARFKELHVERLVKMLSRTFEKHFIFFFISLLQASYATHHY